MAWNEGEVERYELRCYYARELKITLAAIGHNPPPARAFTPPTVEQIASLDYEISGRVWFELWNHDQWNATIQAWLYGHLRDALTAHMARFVRCTCDWCCGRGEDGLPCEGCQGEGMVWGLPVVNQVDELPV